MILKEVYGTQWESNSLAITVLLSTTSPILVNGKFSTFYCISSCISRPLFYSYEIKFTELIFEIYICYSLSKFEF